MTMTNPAERKAVITAARSWAKTPFVWGADVKGAGVDCGWFLFSSFTEPGVKQIDRSTIVQPPPQWFMHRNTGSYLSIIQRFATEYEIPGDKPHPDPADIVIAQFGLDWAHAAIVIDWPHVIAAAFGFVVTEWRDIRLCPQYMNRKLKYFDPWLTSEAAR